MRKSVNKKFLASALLIANILSSCAVPLNTVTKPETINIKTQGTKEMANKAEDFEIKRVRRVTASPSPSITPAPVISASALPTSSPSATALPTLAPSPSALPTLAPSPTALPTPTAIPAVSPSPSATPVPITGDRYISFSGYDWYVRNSAGLEGPGPNNFTNSTDNAFVDSLGQLHLKITQRNGKWYCSEVDLVKSLGYGKYRFYLASRVDQLPQNVVLGLFTYDSDPTYHNREIDIEFSKWGYPTNFNSQYVVQPWDVTQNISRFDSQLSGDYTTHSIDWTTNKVSFESLYGHYATAPDSTYVMNSWSYSGLDIPLAGNEKIIMNLWNYEGKAPTQKVEVVIKKFEFTPITDIYVSR